MTKAKKVKKKKQKKIKYNTLFLKKTKNKGLGVYTDRNIKKGEVVENAPTLYLLESEAPQDGLLANYVFFDEVTKGGGYILVLGLGSLYNHSYKPNLYFSYSKGYMKYIALNDIKAGTELTINYNGDPEDKSSLWFKVKK